MERMAVEFMSSSATVALAILAAVIFIYYGAGLAFYAAVVIAMSVGFINAWLISKAAPEGEVQRAAVTATSRGPERRAARPRRPRKKAGRKA